MDILMLAMIQATGQAPQPARGNIAQSLMLPVILMFLFWIILIVPQRRAAKAHLAMVQALQKGDQVVTAGGLVGVVTSVRDDAVEVRTGTATVVVERSKITRRADPAAAAATKG
jgi:preprotein translocase subunit YajC